MTLPRIDEVLEAELAFERQTAAWAADSPLGWQDFRERYAAATLGDPPAPVAGLTSLTSVTLATGRLRTALGWHALTVFHRGCGTLVPPNGDAIRFRFDATGRLPARELEAARHIPRTRDVLELVIEPSWKAIDGDAVRASLDTARAVVMFDPMTTEQQYAHWAAGRLRTREGWYELALCLGGTTFLITPAGMRLTIELTVS